MQTQSTMVADGSGQRTPADAGPDDDLAINGTSVVITEPAIVDATDAQIGYTRQIRGTRMQAYGDTSTGLFASAGITGDSVGGSTTRIARVQDPDDASKYAWILRCAKTDPDTSGTNSKRAEFRYGATVFYDRWTTTGYKFRQQNYTGHTDEWIIAQIHASDNSSLLNPWFSVNYKSNLVRLVCRYDNTIQFDSSLAPLYAEWNALVIECKFKAADGCLRVWLNGVLVMDYVGALGEATRRDDSYWKSGIYEWDANTQWDDTYPVREIYTKGLYVANGQRGADMHTLLAAA